MSIKTAASVEALSSEPVEGASHFERMVAGARSNNVVLFKEALASHVAKNRSLTSLSLLYDGTGSSLFHIAAAFGSHDIITTLAEAYGDSQEALTLAVNYPHKMDKRPPMCDALSLRHKNTPTAPLLCVKALLAAGASAILPPITNKDSQCSKAVVYLTHISSVSAADIAVDSDDESEVCGDQDGDDE